jgi:protein-tyrosine phosphatase
MNGATWVGGAFGGKRAFLRYLGFRAEAAFGGYRDLRCPDFSQVRRLVFVCKGNICRSPFAEYAARAAAIPAVSAGLAADAGKPADAAAVKAAARRGIDLQPHRSRHLESVELGAGDLVLAFEPLHAAQLRQLLPAPGPVQLALIGLFASPPCPYLHDPYGLSDEYFERCFRRIDDALEGIGRRGGAALTGTLR